MKITTKNILVIAILTTLVTITPSIIFNNVFSIDNPTETPNKIPIIYQAQGNLTFPAYLMSQEYL